LSFIALAPGLLMAARCTGVWCAVVVFALGYNGREPRGMNSISNEDLRWLLALVEREKLAEIEVHIGESQVVVRTSEALALNSLLSQASEDQMPRGPELDEHHIPVLSPLAGVFYCRPSPEADPFVATGDEVVYGDTVGLIEAMKLFNEVLAPATGVISKILAEDGQRVAADEVLMIIET